MSKIIIHYIKDQTGYLLYLLGLFALPLGLFLQFSPYELPKVQYVFLIILYLSQYFFFNEKDFHRKIEKKVTRVLKKELGRTPSQNEIFSRSRQIVSCRGVSIFITTLGIFGLMIFFQEF